MTLEDLTGVPESITRTPEILTGAAERFRRNLSPACLMIPKTGAIQRRIDWQILLVDPRTMRQRWSVANGSKLAIPPRAP